MHENQTAIGLANAGRMNLEDYRNLFESIEPVRPGGHRFFKKPSDPAMTLWSVGIR
jgi:hypothetical protein